MIEEPVVSEDGVCVHPELYVAVVELPEGRGTLLCLMCPECRHAWPSVDAMADMVGADR
jgi:hypothetical protein